ncbi:Glucosamine-phosphate N-acetyltransferase-like protein [Coemansia helicoidea]|uniref:Glucosamine-phosphate N-acetyltransferase-like protein n=1 Tax=Coemansia helicoidea TaxID=1286919 RepID=A0ACC1L3T5_9FUNG|nr:Glucosamine-phosphate N-acetyltransferase-like protein [Coemansia helicoidea]
MVLSNSLFDGSILGGSAQSAVPEGYVLRPLELGDYRKGFVDCLANLSVVGDITEDMFAERFGEMQRTGGSYYVVVIEDLAAQRIAASGTLLVERKMLHGCGTVGHIEDIVVASGQERKRFGQTIVTRLLAISAAVGCYKTILDCDDSNVAFYKKCGMTRRAVQMALYAPKQ